MTDSHTYEYLAEKVGLNNNGGVVAWAAAWEKDLATEDSPEHQSRSPSARAGRMPVYLEYLNEMGQQGWELVCAITLESATGHAYVALTFKRAVGRWREQPHGASVPASAVDSPSPIL